MRKWLQREWKLALKLILKHFIVAADSFEMAFKMGQLLVLLGPVELQFLDMVAEPYDFVVHLQVQLQGLLKHDIILHRQLVLNLSISVQHDRACAPLCH